MNPQRNRHPFDREADGPHQKTLLSIACQYVPGWNQVRAGRRVAVPYRIGEAMGTNSSDVYAWFRGNKASSPARADDDAGGRPAPRSGTGAIRRRAGGEAARAGGGAGETAPRRRHLPRERDGVALRTRAQRPRRPGGHRPTREHRPAHQLPVVLVTGSQSWEWLLGRPPAPRRGCRQTCPWRVHQDDGSRARIRAIGRRADRSESCDGRADGEGWGAELGVR